VFIASVIANYYWIKQLPRLAEILFPQGSSRWRWLDGFFSILEKSGIFSDLLGGSGKKYPSDTRTQTEILRDIERKIDDPYW
jgi:hypothetical protein